MSTLLELRSIAKSLNIKGSSVMKKADLIAMIEKQKMGTEAAPEAPEAAPVAPAEQKQRKPNVWNQYLSEYRQKHENMSLRQAMAAAKDEYKKTKEQKKEETA